MAETFSTKTLPSLTVALPINPMQHLCYSRGAETAVPRLHCIKTTYLPAMPHGAPHKVADTASYARQLPPRCLLIVTLHVLRVGLWLVNLSFHIRAEPSFAFRAYLHFSNSSDTTSRCAGPSDNPIQRSRCLLTIQLATARLSQGEVAPKVQTGVCLLWPLTDQPMLLESMAADLSDALQMSGPAQMVVPSHHYSTCFLRRRHAPSASLYQVTVGTQEPDCMSVT